MFVAAQHCLGFIGSLLACWLVIRVAPAVDLGVISPGWFNIANGITNEFHTWRILPAIRWITGTNEWSADAAFPYLTIFLIGTFFWVNRTLGKVRVSWAPLCIWGASCLVSIGIVWQAGRDTTCLGTLALFTFQAGVFDWWIRTAQDSTSTIKASLIALAVTFFVTVTATYLGNQMSLIASLLAFLIAAITSFPETDLVAREVRGRILGIGLIVAVVPTVLTSMLAPFPEFPDYPATAQVVPDDGLPGIVRPLVGYDYPIQVINRGAISAVYAFPSLILLVLAVISALLIRDRVGRKLMIIAVFLAAAVVIDSAITPGIAVIGPLQSLQRLVPGLSPFCLSPLAFIMSWVIGSLSFCSSGRSIGVALWFAVSCFLVPFWTSGMRADVIRPGVIPELADVHLPEFVSQSPYASLEHREVYISPSLNLIRPLEAAIGTIDLARLKNMSPVAIAGLPDGNHVKAIASSSSERAHRVTDKKQHTRWSPQSGMQLGNEWILIRFATPIQTDGVAIETGRYPADFPRALDVKTAETCGEPKSETPLENIVFTNQGSYVPWLGPILATPRGFPYFGGQSDVRVFFKSTITIQCLLIKQIGKTDYYDWSVAEIGVLRER